MADKTEISWCDSTWNPWIGCTKVGPGCDNCYAETLMDTRYGKVKWGAGKPRVRTSAANWRKPVQWNKRDFYECQDCGWRGEYGDTDKGGCGVCPNPTLTPARRRVFCASLADVFDNEVDPAWRFDLFALIRATPNLDWLVLTKRIGNVDRMFYDAQPVGHASGWPSNVWLGATVVNQEEADRDIPKLLAVPARVRFLSCEPLLGPIKLDLRKCCGRPLEGHPGDGYFQPPDAPQCCEDYEVGIDWVIVGGESGAKARPMHPDWARALRDQCVAAGVPAGVAYHFKQWGSWRPPESGEAFDTTNGRAQKTPAFIVSKDGTVHCFENERTINGEVMLQVGKKAAGRLLDGRTWDEFPS